MTHHPRLPASQTIERRELLKQYLLACIRGKVLTMNDLLTLSAVDNVLRVISTDVKEVLRDIGRLGAQNALAKGAAALGGILADVVGGKPRR